jgi:hypothetical protein
MKTVTIAIDSLMDKQNTRSDPFMYIHGAGGDRKVAFPHDDSSVSYSELQ